jgi:hypothetical protein
MSPDSMINNSGATATAAVAQGCGGVSYSAANASRYYISFSISLSSFPIKKEEEKKKKPRNDKGNL